MRQIINVTNLNTFQTFLGLCAGRIGNIINYTSLANDCGISVPTAKAWMGLLEASYIVFLLQPYYKNYSKRLIKTPKLYFYDTGLACSLLDIESEKALFKHYLRGGIFESYIIADLMKQYYNLGRRPHLYFWRDSQGHEIDCLIERSTDLFPIEIKSSMTITSEYGKAIRDWQATHPHAAQGTIIYAGTEAYPLRTGVQIRSWRETSNFFQTLDI